MLLLKKPATIGCFKYDNFQNTLNCMSYFRINKKNICNHTLNIIEILRISRVFIPICHVYLFRKYQEVIK